jgi:ribose transport system ATP-binding protein
VSNTQTQNAGVAVAAAPALRITHLTKNFPGTRALDDVDLEVRKGSIHALLGGNGSGKSTLIKVLAGIERGDAGGTIQLFDAAPIASDHTTSAWARSAGLRFVHQNPGVFPSMDVAENIAMGLGYPTGGIGQINWDELRAHTSELIRRFKIPGGARTPVGALSPAGRTLVAIARAMADTASSGDVILMLDEPTASLPAREVKLLMGRLRALADDGETIIIVSHRLDEIIDVADRITVLRDGKLVATVETADTTEGEIIELIAGRKVEQMERRFIAMDGGSVGEPLLEVEKLKLFPFLDKVSFNVHRGEVLGIAGLLGSGRTELLMTLFGAMDREGFPRFMQRKGSIRLEGKEIRPMNPGEAMDLGIAYIPEDRSALASFIDWSIRDNITIASIGRYFKGGWLGSARTGRAAQTAMQSFTVKAEDDEQELNQLSGGNQQKVIMARWLARIPTLLLADEPTQGVDVGSRTDIHHFIRNAVDEGACAIVVTSDFEELARISDRVLILHKGKFRAELQGEELTAHRIESLLNLIGIEEN